MNMNKYMIMIKHMIVRLITLRSMRMIIMIIWNDYMIMTKSQRNIYD